MILSDQAILDAVHHGDLSVHPWNSEQLQPASYDLTIGPRTFHYHPDTYSLGDTSLAECGEWRESPAGIFLPPHSFQLGTTIETIRVKAPYAARIEGRSSLGRLGVLAHAMAGHIDPGFEGQITLGLVNASDNTVVIPIGSRVAQLVVVPVFGIVRNPYRGQYQNQNGPTPTRGKL